MSAAVSDCRRCRMSEGPGKGKIALVSKSARRTALDLVVTVISSVLMYFGCSDYGLALITLWFPQGIRDRMSS